jgi:hypothetical protein
MFKELQKKYPTAIIIYYIASMDGDGREVFWGHSPDEKQVRQEFVEAKPDNYDMHLYKALAEDKGDEGYHLIHDEVIETYIDEKQLDF